MTADRTRLRQTFDTVAELYDQARPGYPAAMIDDLARLARLGPDRRVLEIGPGTGQLTVPLAERGCRIVAVELGPSLAEAARRKLRDFPAVEVVNADFERWTPPAERFDLVVAATAFHWLDPERRMDLIAGVLRPGGALAVVETHHVAGGSADFFAEAQECYLRFDPSTPEGDLLRPAAEITDDELFRYEWDQPYTTADYLAVLRTYSSTLDLPPAAAEGLLACIGDLIDRRYGGRITKRYLTLLRFTAVA